MYIVYKLENKINHKIYVGQSSYDFEKRLKEHMCQAKRGSKFKIHAAIRKHGIENFDKEILFESNSHKEILEVEKKYIKEFDSYRNGYNSTPGGEGSPCSIEKALKISQAKRGKPAPHAIGNRHREGYIWYTNGVENISLKLEESIPQGFHKGRTLGSPNRTKPTIRPKFPNGYKPSMKSRKPMTEEHKQKARQQLLSGKGTIWITDGMINKRHNPQENIPDGFCRGKS